MGFARLRVPVIVLGMLMVATLAPAVPAQATTPAGMTQMYVEGPPSTVVVKILGYMNAHGIPMTGMSWNQFFGDVETVVTVPQAVADHYVGEYNAYLGQLQLNPDTPMPSDMLDPTGAPVMQCARYGGISYNEAQFTRYSLASLSKAMHADAYTNAGFTGQGVDVALIDTGVTPVGDLWNPQIMKHGPDLSFDEMVPDLAHIDPFGHGTNMASIIHGVAPGARVVSVKVGDATGNTDVTQVLAAIDWVREHRNANGLHIKVINLSFGLNSLNPATADELSKAEERAWQDGIVVVDAVGNTSPTEPASAVMDPAYNADVLAIAGYDTGSNPLTTADDFYPSFTLKATSGTRKPDLAAPGHVAATHVPNSMQDNIVADELCDPSVYFPVSQDNSLIMGSGSSQAAAMASGAVALMLSTGSRTAGLNPDRVKRTLMNNAHSIPYGAKEKSGDGELDLGAVFNAALPPTTTTQSHAAVTGCAAHAPCLHNTRNGHDLIDVKSKKALDGEFDIFGKPFDGAHHAALVNTDKTWSVTPAGCSEAAGTCTGEMWNGTVWAAASAHVLPQCQGCVLDNGFIWDPVRGLDYWPSVVWPANWAGSAFATANYTGITLNQYGGIATGFSSRSWRAQDWESRSWRGRSWRDDAWK
jgi:serine protease AprX